jgi:hypothetical protein
MSNTLLTDAVFWVSIATMVIGGYKFTLTELYKSKCHTFKLCFGLIKVERNIDAEIKYDIETIHNEQSKRNSNIDLEHQEQKEEV